MTQTTHAPLLTVEEREQIKALLAELVLLGAAAVALKRAALKKGRGNAGCCPFSPGANM